ncbi:MAG TPA: polyamine ABC transporter ATP-binding protein, partial [Blastocatellia bacterium]|nr:polyamine ABC transporter ATP-binding protein [Blastocatellia bacterium]
LLDEPMSSLDTDLKSELLAELKSLQRALGVTTVYITHDRAEALAVAQRIVDQRIVEMSK